MEVIALIVWKAKGDLKNTTQLLKKINQNWYRKILDHYAKKAVDALASATPRDTGKTASSWSYEIQMDTEDRFVIAFNNSNINDGVPIALVIQYGHATPTGGWVEGLDYINPALQPIFDEMAKSLWKEVTSV